MRRNRERLARLAAGSARVEADAAQRRHMLQARVAVCAIIRAGLAQAGVDPARTPALRVGDEAAAELAGLADTPELRRAEAAFDAAYPRSPGSPIAARMLEALSRRWLIAGAAGPAVDLAPALDLANQSLASLLAWRLVADKRLASLASSPTRSRRP